MEEQRARGRGASGSASIGLSASASVFGSLDGGAPTRFTGYETEVQPTTVLAVRPVEESGERNGGAGASPTRLLVKLAESPFYAAGGGQISDVGTIECEHGDCRARVEDVLMVGEDRIPEVIVEQGTLEPGEQVLATRRSPRAARHRVPTTRRRICCRRRCASASAATCARPAPTSGPDKLRFDFSHGQALSEEELRDVEDRVNEWIARNDPVRPITTTLEEAKRLGAMALFGEKYGDVVRMVEVGDGQYSRELCGGTHVRSTAEIGPFRILSETSSAANVRRIEALTGPGGGRAAARARPAARRGRGGAAHAPGGGARAGQDARARAHERSRRRSRADRRRTTAPARSILMICRVA